MKAGFSSLFYTSKAWLKVSRLYMSSKSYVCERCGRPAEICHHKIYLRPDNIDDPEISLNFDNLECLCRECHIKEHLPKHNVTYFDRSGNVQRVVIAKDLYDYDHARTQIDDVVARARALQQASSSPVASGPAESSPQ